MQYLIKTHTTPFNSNNNVYDYQTICEQTNLQLVNLKTVQLVE